MATTRKTLQLLPGIFQTDANRKFLSSTLDQLVSEPEFKRVNNYVGRQFGTEYSSTETYIQEPSTARQNYQLEVALTRRDDAGKVTGHAGYTDLINRISYYGGITTDHNRLFENEYYTFAPPVNLDKLVNYQRYYWLPVGPDSIEITSRRVFSQTTYNFVDQGTFITTNVTGTEQTPTLVLRRGVTYTFNTSLQSGNLFIQSEPGRSGTKQYAPSVSSRNISGVTNNGTSAITFTVPVESAQDALLRYPVIDNVEYAIDETLTTLDNVVWNFGDGMSSRLSGDQFYPDGVEFIFLSTSTNNADWTTRTGQVITGDARRGIWRMNVVKYSGQPVRVEVDFVRNIPNNTRVLINQGVRAGKEYIINSNQFQEFSGITAESSTLFYQLSDRDVTGKIEIVENQTSYDVNVSTIIGSINYTSPSGVQFVNGMKVRFDSTVSPSQYQNKSYFVEGVGTGIKLISLDDLQSPEALSSLASVSFDIKQFDVGNFDESLSGSSEPDYIVADRSSKDLNAWSRINRWFHEDVIIRALQANNYSVDLSKFTRATRPIIEFLPDIQLFNYGSRFASYVTDFFDADFRYTVNGQSTALTSAYNTINTARFRDLRQVGIVIEANTNVVFAGDADPVTRRTVYRVNRLDQIGTSIFDGFITGNIILDGTNRVTGQNTNFTSQLETGDNIYLNSGALVGTIQKIMGDNELYLTETVSAIGTYSLNKYNSARVSLSVTKICEFGDNVVVIGGSNVAKTFYLKNINGWQSAQQKTKLNQPPLFDIVTRNGVSISESYNESSFAGTKLFSYKEGSGYLDNVLKFSISYSGNSSLSGDIVFDNNYDKDIFEYRGTNVLDAKIKQAINIGYIKQNTSPNSFNLLTNYKRVNDPSRQFKHIKAQYDAVTNYFEIGVIPEAVSSVDSNLRVYVNGELVRLTANEYRVERVGDRIALVIDYTLLKANDQIDIFVYSKAVSEFGYYTIPQNLEVNPLNQTSQEISFGQMRSHLRKIGERNRFVTGDVFATSNLNNLDYTSTPGLLLQHSASIVPALAFITDEHCNFQNAVEFAQKEYARFKFKFLETISNYVDATVTEVPTRVDEILNSFAQVKNTSFPWYFSDMVPFGQSTITTYRISNSGQRTYNIDPTFSLVPSNRAIVVYLNDRILVRDRDYTIDSDPTISLTSTVAIAEGDVIKIKEYTNTDANFIPETPTKLGLYPKFVPEKIYDETYSPGIYMLQGHDGSLLPAFNDIRDNFILELESRIYNNIKVNYTEDLFAIGSVVPGKFRNTDYTRAEFNSVLGNEFLKWVGSNQLNYNTNNQFAANNEWTWNYNQAQDLDGERIPGYWRGIYRYFYDTDRPHSHPWEMLGLTVKPIWWDDHYSWTDTAKRATLISALTNGRYTQPGTNTYTTKIKLSYARPNFEKYVPVDVDGKLLSPQRTIVSGFDSARLSRNFAVGDAGPIESAWLKSSEYPFALQRALSLLKPAKYFGLYADISAYERRTIGLLEQYFLKNKNTKFNFTDLTINGELIGNTVTRASGYINWIHGYLTGLGIDPGTKIRNLVKNATVNLTYKFAGFTDKKYLRVLADQISLTSTSESVVIPDENYAVYLNKGMPEQSITYSAVIVEKTANGYSVTGYDQRLPYFTIIPSQTRGSNYKIEVLGETYTIFEKFYPQKIRIPYGFEFTSQQQVVDFLVSYQRFLQAQGILFDTYDSELGEVRNWFLSIQEFVTWAKQGWASGNIIVLSPVYDTLNVFNENYHLDDIDNNVYGSQIIGTNFDIIRNADFTVLRDSKRSTIRTVSQQTIAFARLNLIQYEHVLVLDNKTIFNDTLYNPEVGDRQYRLKLVGAITDSWDGDLTPPGFVYSNGQIDQWQKNYDYKKGSIVSYKGINYSALEDLAGADSFAFNKWTKLDAPFREGLAANFSQNAAKFKEIYDVDVLPNDEQLAIYSSGLIGFKPREYLDALGITAVSQVKFYQGFIKSKGTTNAIRALAKADFDGTDSDLAVYEEWGARIGSYGAIDSNPSYSFLVTDDNNPSLYQFTRYGEKASNQAFTTINPTNLLSTPENYQPNIFKNRNVRQSQRTWKVELFGDSIMCGKKILPEKYGIEIVRRHGYNLGLQTRNAYSVVVTGVYNQEPKTFVNAEEPFGIQFTSLYQDEVLYVTIEPADTTVVPLSRTVSDILSSTGIVLPQQEVYAKLETKDPYERVYVSFEPISANEIPNTTLEQGTMFLPDTLTTGDEFFIKVNSVQDRENLYWTIEEVTDSDIELTGIEGFANKFAEPVCISDKSSGRVDSPPDYLLYESLKSTFNLAITTRSAENSTSTMLLMGSDGVNGVWPDDIDADIVVINHGYEDAKAGINVSTYKNNLKTLRSRLEQNRSVIWQLPGPIDVNNAATTVEAPGSNNLEPYRSAMRDVALEYGDSVVDITSLPNYANLLAVDGIHFTQEGYETIVNQLLAPAVRSVIYNKISSELRNYEDDLRTAGYVLTSEVDDYIFDITDAASLSTEFINSIVNGSKIWVAKNYNNDWQVYRAYTNSYTITDARADLNAKLVFTTSAAHGLLENDVVIVKNFDSAVNGFYQIISVNGLEFTVLKVGLDTQYRVTERTGTLIDMQPLRFTTLDQARNTRPKHGWIAYDPQYPLAVSDLLYIDNQNNPGSWAVYQPSLVDTQFENIFFSNVITSNAYSVVGINCIIANSTVSAVNRLDEINFCVFSVDDSEELYYSIETAVASDNSLSVIINGEVKSYANVTIPVGTPVYSFTRIRQYEPRVDIDSINNLYLFDNVEKNITTRIDLYDPAKGKILGKARQEIDYISENDPAKYRNTDTSVDYRYSTEIYWSADQVGTYWWNTDRARFIDYEQGNLDYRRANWGKLFPGSTIEVYEWISSDVLPSVHVSEGREGIPLYPDDQYYSDAVFVDPSTGAFISKYFFWVRATSNKTAKNKNLSTSALEEMIANPGNQGIPYMAALRDDAVAVYNLGSYYSSRSVMYIASKLVDSEKLIHNDFALLQQGNYSTRFPDIVETKLIDSLVGMDVNGELVPDQRLPLTNRIGMSFRPRQSLIVNLKSARTNILQYLNEILIKYPIAFRVQDNDKIYSDNLFAKDPDPASSLYSVAVDTYSQIYQPTQTASTINIFVRSDETIGGYWAIYQRSGTVGQVATAQNTSLRLIKKQNFDVSKVWHFVDWYAIGYSATIVPTYVVDNFKDIYKLTLTDGDIIRVRNIASRSVSLGNNKFGDIQVPGNWEMYVYTNKNSVIDLTLIALQNRTIQFNASLYTGDGFDAGDFDVPVYDYSNSIELRYIFQALKQDLFVQDLKDEYNRMLFAVINYILSEQKYIDWFFKTSFVSVRQIISDISNVKGNIKDRQKHIESYIEEIKPYRTKIREFISSYGKTDLFINAVTDFDIPPYYDRSLSVYRSPSGELPTIDLLQLQKPEYAEWRNNYKYDISDVVISNSGYGFQTPDNSQLVPDIEILRNDLNAGTEANISVKLDNSNFGINKIYVDKVGTNYTVTPSVRIIGSGANTTNDDDRHEFTVVTQGYSYFSVGNNNRLGFGLFGRSGNDALTKNYLTSLISTLNWSTGSGSITGYTQNGLTAENQRVRDTDPWSQSSVVWETRPTGDNNADGGWTTAYFDINPTRTYRSAVWVRRTTSDSGGTFNHGIMTNGTHPTYAGSPNPTGSVRRISDGFAEFDPYWNTRPVSDYSQNEWYLHVSYIFPHTHTGTSVHPESGIYTRRGGKVLANSGNITDALFPANASQAVQRVYHSNSANAFTKLQFAFPRFDLVDGNQPTVDDLLNYGPYQDVLYKFRSIGYHLHKIRRVDGRVVFSRNYQLYYQNDVGYTGYTSADLVSELNKTTDDYVVVVQTYDDAHRNRLTNNLHTALQRCGASEEVFGKPNTNETTFKVRSGYILVGIPGCGTGRGLEHYAGSFDNAPDAYASVTFKIERGYLAAIKSDPKHYVFAVPFAIPSNPTAGQSFKYGERIYTYDGKTWRSQKVISATLSTNREPQAARLSVRLSNRKIRKVSTTLRFDRVQYTSKVVAWQPNVTYPVGTFLAYENRAYEVIGTAYNRAIFNPLTLRLVPSSEFDNANDRIISYYEPSVGNGMIPKDLGKLVPGINPLYNTIITNPGTNFDTILLGDTFGSNAGISAGNIKVSGGKFVDRIFTTAPEELLPGSIYDSLSIRVLAPSTGQSLLTTTTTAGPSPLTLSVLGSNVSYVEVPYAQNNISTTDSFTLSLDGYATPSPYPVTISLVEAPGGGTANITPSSLTLLPGQQQTIRFTTNNSMLNGTTWYDLSPYNNHFQLLDSSPVWTATSQGKFTFGASNAISDRASSINAMSGINTTAGEYNTVCMWVRWTGGNDGIVMEWKTGYRLWMKNGGLGFGTTASDAYGVTPQLISAFQNSWMFIAAVFHNTVGGSTYTTYNKLYINGSNYTLTQFAGAATSGTAGIGITLANATDPSANPDAYEFDGDIGEVYVYNKQLTADEVADMFFATRDRFGALATTTTTTTSTTSTTTSTSTTTLPALPALPAGIPSSNAAWGGNGFGGTFNYRGGYSVSGGHMGNGGGGGASPLGGVGGAWALLEANQGDYGTGGSGGGYTVAGTAGTGALPGYNSSTVNATGVGNGGGSVETDKANASIAVVNGGDGTGGLVRITILGGGYTFTNTDLTNYNATRLINGGQAIEWDNSANVNKRSSSDVYHNALQGTFTVPAGVTAIDIGVIAGGAGGAVGPCTNAGGGGGGAALRSNYTVTSGTQYIIKVGAGGQGARQTTARDQTVAAPYGVVSAPWRGGRSAFCNSSGTEIVYATGGNTRPDDCAGVTNSDSASANTMD